MRESGRDAKGPQSTSDAKSENQDTGTSPPSVLSRSIGMPCYLQFPSLLMRALFILIVNQS